MGGKKLPKTMPPCEVEGCSAKVWQRTNGRFLCVSHSQKLRKYGSVFAIHPRYKRKARWIDAHKEYKADDCLKWPFGVSAHGRGTVQINNKSMSAPRAMCYLAHGAPPEESYHAAHSCGNGHLGCMNPRHISWKTPSDNEADKAIHGTVRRGTDVNTSRLSEEDVRAIRSMIGKVSGIEIARAWGITPAMVSNIKLGKAWAWLE